MPQHYHCEGHIHYLTFSCYRRLWLFRSSFLYQMFLNNLSKEKKKLQFKLYGYVLMPNHVHLLIYPTPDCTISRILWAVKRPFSYQALRYFRERQPDVFQQLIVKEKPRLTHRYWQAGGGYDRNLFRDETFITTLNYMHQNPVRKGFVTKPEAWKWSSIHFYLTRNSEDINLDWPEWW